MRLAALRGIYILTVADIGWAAGWYIRPLFAGLAAGAVLAWGVTAAYYYIKGSLMPDAYATGRSAPASPLAAREVVWTPAPHEQGEAT